MNYTTNFNLRLPERSEQFNLDDWNNNTKSIDSAMQTNKTNISNNATNITSILTGLSTVNTSDTSSIYYKLMKLIYPVGSLYWSSKSTNPASLFGGTWVQIKDRFVLACGNTYTSVGKTGGNSSVTLTVSNMPSHTHSFTPSGSVSSHSHSFSGSDSHYHTTISQSPNSSEGMSGSTTGTFVASTRWYAAWGGVSGDKHITGRVRRESINHNGNKGGEDSNQDSKYTIDFSHTHNISHTHTTDSQKITISGTTGSTQPTFTGSSGTTGSN